VLGWLKRRYRVAVSWGVRHAGPVGLAAAVICLLALAALPFFGATFLPEFREGHYLIHMSAVPGTSLDESLRLGQRVTAALKADPRIRSVAQRIGRAELSEDTWGTNYTEFEVALPPLSGEAAERMEDDLRSLLAGFPGVNFAIRGFLSERSRRPSPVRPPSWWSGSTATTWTVSTSRPTRGRRLGAVPGTADVQYDPPPVTPV
jgi:Cu/Ag efflux pump CusA